MNAKIQKEGLATKILRYAEENTEFTLQELYTEFGEYKPHSVRARIYESDAYKENKLIKTANGTYTLVGVEVEAIVECVDSREHIYTLTEAKLKYDLLFLDLPYNVGGVRGGNRTLVDYDLITPEEFGEIIVEAEKLLKNENSQVFFMIAGGKSSIKDAEKYIRMFDKTNLILNNRGSYTKLTSQNKVCNMGKYPMPPEIILSFSLDGKECVNTDTKSSMDYKMKRPPLPRSGGYRTEKPLSLLKAIVERSTKAGDKILDMFSGSGVTVEAGLRLKRKVHCLELSKNAIEKFIIPRIKIVVKEISNSSTPQPTVQTTLFDFI